jgi:putative membrane protein
VSHWQLQPLQLIPAVGVALLYWLRARELARKGRPVARLRQAAFFTGLALAVGAVISPLDWTAEHRLLWVHMVQHLVLGDVAPLLVVLGLNRGLLRPLLAVRWVRRLRPLGHPLIALPLWTVDLYAWHLRVPYQAALQHDGVHALEHACFFACGALMWGAVVEPLPGPVWLTRGWKAVYTLAVRTAGGVLGNLFVWAGHAFYPYYAVRNAAPLTDQRIAGAIMFTEGSLVTLAAFAWLFLGWARELEVRQRLIEHDLDPVVAARAARYGRAARVRDVMR